MKISVDIGNAPPKTGIGIYGRGLISALRDYAADELTLTETKTSWVGTHLRPLRRAVYLLRLKRLARRRYSGADVVHFTNQYVPARVRGVSYVMTVHDLDPILAPDAHTRRYVEYFKRVVRNSLDRVDLVEVHTKAVLEDACECFHTPQEKFRVVGDGLMQNFILQAGVTSPRPMTFPTLLYVGQISKKKNVAWLARTVSAGIRKGALPMMKLVVAGGPGHGFDEFRAELSAAQGRVEWLRRPELEELVRLYRGCNAVILPSLREGFGRPLLEAMFCDRPIVASKIPSNQEVGGDGGHYFRLGDVDDLFQCIKDAFEDKNQEIRRKKAATQLERYSWSNLSRMYVDLYKEASRIEHRLMSQ